MAESVSAADKFNPVNFMFLLLFVGLIGLWIYSMFPLLGKFGKTIGNFTNPKGAIVQSGNSMATAVADRSFIITPTRGADPDPTAFFAGGLGSKPTATPEPTYTPAPISGPDLSYNPAVQYYQPVVPTATPTVSSQGDPLEPTDRRPSDQLPELVYDLDYSLYTRSDDLWIKYHDQEVIRTISGKYSYYWPPLGGTNCDIQWGKEECLYVADGTLVEDRIGVGWACDLSIPLGSIIEIVELDLFGICVDRGYTIRQDPKDGLFWFDHLMEWPLLDWEAPITVHVRQP